MSIPEEDASRNCYLHPHGDVVQLERGERVVEVHLECDHFVAELREGQEVGTAGTSKNTVVTSGVLSSQLLGETTHLDFYKSLAVSVEPLLI